TKTKLYPYTTLFRSSKESYNKTISIIQEAEDYIEAKAEGKALFGGKKYESLDIEEREYILAQILPVIRGLVSEDKKMIVTNDTRSEEHTSELQSRFD